jgi:hypothetical protein
MVELYYKWDYWDINVFIDDALFNRLLSTMFLKYWIENTKNRSNLFYGTIEEAGKMVKKRNR